MATKVTVVVHPSGLHPLMQAKAHHLHREEGLPLDDVRDAVLNMHGKRPGHQGTRAPGHQGQPLAHIQFFTTVVFYNRNIHAPGAPF